MFARRYLCIAAIGLLLSAGAAALPGRPRGTPVHAAALGGTALTPDADLLPDPFSIQRTVLPAERFERLKPEIAKGTYRSLSKIEFEAKVQAAARERIAAQNPPRLLEATYRASVESGRVSGTADWTLGHPSNAGGAMAIDPLPGAIQSPKWTDGSTPILYRSSVGGKPPAPTYLWVEGPTQSRFEFQWSTRIVELPDEERCALTFPASPIALLELTLDAARIPRLDAPGALLTGPFPAAVGDKRLWKVAFGGRTQLDLAFRKGPTTDDSKAAVGATCAASWKLLRSETEGRFDIALQSTRQGSRQRIFRVDPGLQIAGVTGPAVESWHWEVGSPTRELTVRFRDDAQAARFAIAVRAPAALASGSWTPPQIRLADGFTRAENIEILLAPECKLDGWQPGDYRIGSTSTAPDHSTKLEFIPAFAATEGRVDRRPPTIRIRASDREFTTVETLDWRLEPGRTKVALTCVATVVRGPISSFAFRAPAGYLLVNAAISPDDPGVAFGVQPGSSNGWFVEPTRAVASGSSLEIRLEFRSVDAAIPPDSARSDLGRLVPIPKIVPVGAVQRRGAISVRPAAGVKVTPAGSDTNAVPPLGESGYTWNFRGREPDVEVFVTRAKLAISAVSETSLTGTASLWQIASKLRGRAGGAPLESLLVWVPGETATWALEPGAVANRVPGDALLPWLAYFGAGQRGFGVALAAVAQPEPGTFWRILFGKPVSGEFTCRVDCSVPRRRSDRVIARPHFLGVSVAEETVKLDPDSAREFRAEPAGHPPDARPSILLTPIDSVPAEVATPAGRAWVYRNLQLQGRVEPDGVRFTLRGVVAETGAARLPVALDGAKLESVTLDGKLVVVTAAELENPGVPIRPGAEIEVRFFSPSRRDDFAPIAVADATLAPLPDGPEIARTWSAGPDLRSWPSLETGELNERAERVQFVRESTVAAAGRIAAVLLAFPMLIGVASSRYRAALVAALAVSAALGFASWLAPPGWSLALRPPLLTALGGAAVALWFQPAQRPTSSGLVWIVAASVFASDGIAQAPETVVVFVVSGPSDATEGYRVLVPKTALDKLDALAQSGVPTLAILSADYECLAAGETVNVRAKFQILSQKADEQILALPLAGVRLEKAALDGRDAFPDAGQPDRYHVAIRGAGRHELIASFAVPVQSAGIDRDAKFGAPDLPIARVSFAAGLRGRQLDVPSRRGGQSLRVSADGLRVEAAHGGGRTIRLYWRESGTADGAKPTVTVKEGAVWDLDEANSTLAAAWQYRVEGGTLSTLKIEWPERVLPTRVRLISAQGDPLDSGVRNWKVGPPANGTVPIEVKLQSPLEGRFTLIVKGDSTEIPSVKPVLRYPRCTDVADADRDSFHAVRFAGLKSEGIVVGGAIDFPADAVAREFANVPEFQFAKSPPARVVRRAAGQSTELRPTLVPNAAYQPLAGEVAYTIGRRIGVDGAMRASAQSSGSVEFDVPADVQLNDVWTPELAGWSRAGSRVQVWLTRPVAEVIIRWSGQLPNATPADGIVELPLPRWPSAAAKFAEPVTVRVRAASGWSIQPIPVVGLKTQPASPTDDWVLTVQSDQISAVKFTAKSSPKFEPVAGRPKPIAPTPAPPPVAASPSDAIENPEPIPSGSLRPGIWLFGVLAVAALAGLGGRRWRPESFLLLGAVAAAILGIDSLEAIPFWCVAAYGAALRGSRGVRWLLRGKGM